jgi:hypothetical protein
MRHRALVILVVAAACIGTLAGQGWAQRSLVSLFEGEPSDVPTISVGSWGGAECVQATDFVLLGRMSIRVRTSDEFRGGRIDMLNPPDLGAAFANPNAYIQFVVYSAGRSQRSTVSLTDPRAGGAIPGGPRVPGGPGGYTPGGPGYPPGGPGGAGAALTASAQQLGYSPINEIRTILFFEEGVLVVDRQKVEPYRQDEAGWSRFSVPLAKLKGAAGLAGYHLKRVVICGDTDDVLYIGEIAIVEDDTPILTGSGEEYEIWKGQTIGLMANANGGAAALEYSWDFDASDGITEDATGPVVQHTYPETGDYTVTVTVRDVNGIKEPKKIEHIVHVISG